MKWIVFLVLVATLLTGCGVSRKNVTNWKPNDEPRAASFYECLQQAQQIESTAAFEANRYAASGRARTGAKTNKHIFEACMNSKGYRIRGLTNGELLFSLVSLPISIPFALLQGDLIDFY